MSNNRIIYYIKKVLHNLKCFVLSLSNKDIRISKSSYFFPSVELEVAKTATLNIHNGVMISKDSYIGVREKASLSIGQGAFINRKAMIVAREKISIGSKVTIGPNCCIFDHDHSLDAVGKYVTKEITIGDNVWIGASVVILKGVHIGANSVVAAGSVVVKDIPENVVFVQKRESFLSQIN